MLHGFDISRHNGGNAVKELIKQYPDKTDFFIIKATEGRTYVDPCLDYFAQQTLSEQRLLGFYHFCRADNENSPESEATNFCNAVDKYIGRCMLIADYEGKSLKVGENWLNNFCKSVKNLSGITPLVYLQYSEIRNFSVLARENCGLWVAKWGEKPHTVTPWSFYAMWQYTNKYDGKNLDANYFNGNVDQFMKYCELKQSETLGDCYCGCSCCNSK